MARKAKTPPQQTKCSIPTMPVGSAPSDTSWDKAHRRWLAEKYNTEDGSLPVPELARLAGRKLAGKT